MGVNSDKFLYSGLETIIGIDLETNQCLFIIDEIRDGTISGTADQNWHTGKFLPSIVKAV